MRVLGLTVLRRKRWVALGAATLGVIVLAAFLPRSSSAASTCFGTPARGALENGHRLPRVGVNFRAYSDVGWVAGRTFVHDRVKKAVLDAYRALEDVYPEHRFVYGETGFAEGGRFAPHRTHQNGLSVDFLVPVREISGVARELSTTVLDEYGYAHELDRRGGLGDLRTDFEAIARHLAELSRAARANGLRIGNVIYAPELRAQLRKTRSWAEIRDLPFTTKTVWVRHDEHYHVDFATPCQPLRP